MTDRHDPREPIQTYEIGHPPSAAATPSSASTEPRPSTVVALTTGHFMVDFFTNLLTPLLPIIYADLGFTLTAGAAIASASSFAAYLLQPVFGLYIDRVAGGGLLIPSVLWTAVFAAAIGLTRNYWAILILATLAGLGDALYHPLGSVTLGGLTTRRRGWLMSLYSAGGSVGFAVAPMIAIPLVAKYGLISFVWMLPLGFAGAFLMHGIGVAKVRAKPVDSARPGPAGLWRSMRPNLRSLAMMNLIVTLRAWGMYAITFLVPLYYLEHGYSRAMTSIPLTMFLLVGTVGGMAGGYLSDRFGRRPTIIVSSLLSAILFFALRRLGAGYLSWAALAVIGAVFQAALPAAIVFAQELFPENAGMASGIVMGLAWGFGAIGLSLTGWVSEHAGLTLAMDTTPVILLVAGALCVFLPRDKRGDSGVGPLWRTRR
jgi:FSR family fosmidomycin resistance protein-like MFS transporter